MTEQELRDELLAATREGRPAKLGDGGCFIAGPGYYVEARQAVRVVLLVLLALVLLALIPTAAQAAGSPQTTVDCDNFNHHTPTPFVAQAIRSGHVWGNKRTGDVIVAARIAACAGKWLIVIYRRGRFTTHFFPAAGLNYIMAQVRGGLMKTISWGEIKVRSVWLFILVEPCPGYIATGRCQEKS